MPVTREDIERQLEIEQAIHDQIKADIDGILRRDPAYADLHIVTRISPLRSILHRMKEKANG